MEITIAGQTWMFLLSIALGAALGVCYDVFRIVRIAVPNPPAVIVAEDLAYAVICTVATFLFFLTIDCGQIRLFVLFGEVIGFVLYYCTIGVLVLGVSRRIIGVVHFVCGVVWRVLLRPVWVVLEKISGVLIGFIQNIAKCIKTTAKNSRIHLKKHSGLLYNLNRPLRSKRKTKKVEG